MALLLIDRSWMTGKSGRVYRVIGEADVPQEAVGGDDLFLVVSVHSPANYRCPWPPAPGRQTVHWEGFSDVGRLQAGANDERLIDEAVDRLAASIAGTSVRKFVFQCEAGMSRSAALCVAVARHFGDDKVAAECYERYDPNELVVQKMQAALLSL